MIDCFIGLGGNQENTLQGIRRVIASLKNSGEIHALRISKLYRTSPVSKIRQPHYLNAVCRFYTSLPLLTLWSIVEQLELDIGKKPKSKEAPRLIDLDLLFYGSFVGKEGTLIIPHPHWHERLFVLAPLSDVAEKVPISDEFSIQEMLKKFTNPHNEQAVPLLENLDETS